MISRSLVLAVLLGALSGVASAQSNVAFGSSGQDTDAPVEVTAENLSVDQEAGIAIFTGDVIVGQGAMRLNAPRVLVVYSEDAQSIDRVEATGGVTLVSGEDAAEADAADYDIDRGTIVMTGEVLLSQGLSAIAADRMTVNLDDGTAQMSGSVKTILQPGGN